MSEGRQLSRQLSYQRALFLVTGTSLMVPVVGLATAPILSHVLGVAGRGEAAAAMAPNLLIVGGATLGLPAALTYYLAKHPQLSRVAIGWASLFSTLLGLVTLVGVYIARPYLSNGDADLSRLMLIGTLFALPSLVVGLLRGAASGRQMWRAVAFEKAANTVLRLVLLGGAALLGRLDVTSAVVIMCVAPIVSGLSYLGLIRRPPSSVDVLIAARVRRTAPDLLAFGSQVWLGSVATMLMARLSQLLVTPLSDVEQLGLLIVAITVSDVPYIVTQTVREVTFGANSAESDADRLLATSRIATLIAAAGSFVLGITLPIWIELVFGPGFGAAVVPTWLLLLAACSAVPGLMAGAALDSGGRPGLRSAALALALVVNVAGLLALVPPLGAVGAAVAALTSTLTSTIFGVAAASRLQGSPRRAFFVPRAADVALLRATVQAVLRRIRPAQSAAAASARADVP
jgi:O-antigen/teichoic acid export membrane protein